MAGGISCTSAPLKSSLRSFCFAMLAPAPFFHRVPHPARPAGSRPLKRYAAALLPMAWLRHGSIRTQRHEGSQSQVLKAGA